MYCYAQTDCFLVSQLFSVARYMRHTKPGSKTHLTLRQTDYIPLSQASNSTSVRELTHIDQISFVYIFALSDADLLNSFEDLCITWMATILFFHQRTQPPLGEAYILSHTDRLFCYIYIYIYICVCVCVCVCVFLKYLRKL